MRSDLPAATPSLDLRGHGLINTGRVYANLSAAELVEQALLRHEAHLSARGALVALTGSHTGRSPRDRYLVADPACKDDLWWGPVNRPLEPAVFDHLLDRVRAYVQGRDLFVCDAWACADPRHASAASASSPTRPGTPCSPLPAAAAAAAELPHAAPQADHPAPSAACTPIPPSTARAARPSSCCTCCAAWC